MQTKGTNSSCLSTKANGKKEFGCQECLAELTDAQCTGGHELVLGRGKKQTASSRTQLLKDSDVAKLAVCSERETCGRLFRG